MQVGLARLARSRGQQVLGRGGVGDAGADHGAGAGTDVDVEVVDAAVEESVVEGAQGADMVDGAGESAPGEHQGGAAQPGFALVRVRRARGCFLGVPDSTPRAPAIPSTRLASSVNRPSNRAMAFLLGIFTPRTVRGRSFSPASPPPPSRL